MADSNARLYADATGKLVRLFMLRGVRQDDGSVADVYVQCQAVVDFEGRTVDQDAVLTELRNVSRELSRLRKGIGDFIDNAELMLDTDDSDEEDGDDDGGES